MKMYEQAVYRRYGNLLIDLKVISPKQRDLKLTLLLWNMTKY